jgi:mannosyltransferase
VLLQPLKTAGTGLTSCPRRVSSWLPLAGVIALAAGLAWVAIGEKGFWLDEALSVQRASAAWPALWRDITGTQANMALYYVLLHGWIALGDSEVIVRTLSALFAVAAVPAVYRLTSVTFGGRTALTASLLLALNSFFISYAQEARGYSLAILIATLSTLCFVTAMERPSRGRWLAHALVSGLALYAHFFCALVILAQAASLVFARRGQIPWRGLLGSGAAIVVAALPLAWFVAFHDVGQIDWVPAPRAIDLYLLFATFAGGGWALPVLCGLAILGGAIFAMRDRIDAADPRQRWRVALLLCWLIVPAVVAYAASAVKPVFQPRFLIVSVPPFVMLAALGLTRLRQRAVFASAVALVAVLSFNSVRAWYDEPDKQWWRAAAQHVASRAEDGDAIAFFVYSARVPFEYYGRRLGLTEARVTFVDIASDDWVAGNRQPDPSPARLRALAEAHPRVWLVRLQDATPPGHPLRRHEQGRLIESALAARYTMARESAFPGGIRIQLYEHAGEHETVLEAGAHLLAHAAVAVAPHHTIGTWASSSPQSCSRRRSTSPACAIAGWQSTATASSISSWR